jgi:hypothetical protein
MIGIPSSLPKILHILISIFFLICIAHQTVFNLSFTHLNNVAIYYLKTCLITNVTFTTLLHKAHIHTSTYDNVVRKFLELYFFPLFSG